jgi:type I restriction enzyme S subunit
MNVSAVPVHWTRPTLRELATINYGRDPSAILREDGQYPVYGTSGRERNGTGYLYEGESIILGRKGTIDRIHFATGRFWAIDTAYFLSRFADALPKWLYYFLSRVDLRALNEATGVPSLSRDRLYKIVVEKPPGPEQSKIAEVLSTVDQAIEQTEALIAKQQRIKTGLMQDLLTRGIDEHGNLRSEQTHEFKDSSLGRVPAAWDVVHLNQCAATDAPICYGILMPGRGYDNGVPVIKVKDIFDGRILQDSLLLTDPRIDRKYRRSRLRAGDLLITIRGTTGRVAVVPPELDRANITQDTARIRLADEFSTRFFYYTLQSRVVQDQVALHTIGQAVKGINIGDVKRMSVILPSLGEQNQIADRLESIDLAFYETTCQLHKLTSLKAGLMQDLLTGTRRVTALLEP